MIRSIRVTLTLWYVGILAVLLCAFGWILYTKVSVNLMKDVDQILISEANGIADSIFAFWQAKWEAEHHLFEGSRQETLAEHLGEIEKESIRGDFANFLSRWAHELTELHPAHAMQVVDQNGNPIFATKIFNQLHVPLIKEAIQDAKKGRTIYESFYSPEHYRIRVILYPIIENGYVLYIVKTAATLKQIDSSLERLKLGLFGLIPLTLIFATAVGWFFATIAFRPIGRLIKQAKNISAEHLHERVDVPKTGDELEELGKTFNDMLARLERAFKRLRQFSAAASHELRTPLTIIKGELEVALRSTRDVQEYQRVLKTQLEALDEMIDIVEQLLTLARSEEGEESMEWCPIELTHLIENVFGNWRKIIRDKAIQINFVKNSPIWIRGEEPLVQRVFSNLLDNALKHTPANGHIRIEMVSQNNEAVFIIEDSGPGISKQEQPYIFDKFFTKRSVMDNDSTGVGLGLCRWIVEAHQGKIEISSEPEKGACFKVFFPLSQPN